MSHSAVIMGLSGLRLSAEERAFFRDCDPWAFILFARNVETPEQVSRLTAELRDCVGRDCLVFIDQEGGRVQRMRPPHWRNYPSGAQLSEGYADDRIARRRAVYLHHRLIAADLLAVGVNADCAPVLDIPQPGADAIISDRAFGDNTEQVIDLGQAAMDGLLAGGVAPVIKHIPGHGRAMVDSHLALPRVDTGLDELTRTDFKPFKALKIAPMAMSAHIVYEAQDDAVLTLSKSAIDKIIRGDIGFDGLLMSDDLDMKALSGGLTEKTARALAAGCDIALHCSGDLVDMVKVASGAKPLSGQSLRRAKAARLSAGTPDVFDAAQGWDELCALVPSLNAVS